jgi:hypothetical protein
MSSEDRAIHVKITPDVMYDFDKISKVLQKTLTELGCPACCSGYDIRFDVERNFIADSNFDVKVDK